MYKGAGILFIRKTPTGTEILLGKRNIHPQKGYWSVIGGKMDKKDQKDFFRCARRECQEEIFHNMQKEFNKIDFDKVLVVTPIYIPFVFRWKTFIIDITDLKVLFNPDRKEVSSVDWYNTRKLPDKTHLGIKYSLLFLK